MEKKQDTNMEKSKKKKTFFQKHSITPKFLARFGLFLSSWIWTVLFLTHIIPYLFFGTHIAAQTNLYLFITFLSAIIILATHITILFFEYDDVEYDSEYCTDFARFILFLVSLFVFVALFILLICFIIFTGY